jgi:hypothetical protein
MTILKTYSVLLFDLVLIVLLRWGPTHRFLLRMAWGPRVRMPEHADKDYPLYPEHVGAVPLLWRRWLWGGVLRRWRREPPRLVSPPRTHTRRARRARQYQREREQQSPSEGSGQ